MATISDILNNVLETLRDIGLFSSVVFGEDCCRVDMPRASVAFCSLESHLPDDTAAGSWVRLVLELRIRTRRGSDGGEDRLDGLVEAACAALLVDSTRGGLCSDLPIGAATELDGTAPEKGLADSIAGRTTRLTCHYERA